MPWFDWLKGRRKQKPILADVPVGQKQTRSAEPQLPIQESSPDDIKTLAAMWQQHQNIPHWQQWAALRVLPANIIEFSRKFGGGFLNPELVVSDMKKLNYHLGLEGYSFQLTVFDMLAILPKIGIVEFQRDGQTPHPLKLAVYLHAERLLRLDGMSRPTNAALTQKMKELKAEADHRVNLRNAIAGEKQAQQKLSRSPQDAALATALTEATRELRLAKAWVDLDQARKDLKECRARFGLIAVRDPKEVLGQAVEKARSKIREAEERVDRFDSLIAQLRADHPKESG